MKTFLYKAPKTVTKTSPYMILLVFLSLGVWQLYRFFTGEGILGIFIGVLLLGIGFIMFSYYYQITVKKHYLKVSDSELYLPSIYFNEQFKLTTPLILGTTNKPFPYTVIRSFYVDQHEEETFISIILNTKPVFVFRYSKDWFQEGDFEAFTIALRGRIEEEKL